MSYIQSIFNVCFNGITYGNVGSNGVVKNQLCTNCIVNIVNDGIDMHKKASIGNFNFIQRATILTNIRISCKTKIHFIVGKLNGGNF